MANNPQIGRFLYPQGLLQLTKGRGWNSELVGFLLPYAIRNYIYKAYDFIEDTITSDWSVGGSGGAAAANYAATTTVENGIARGNTGTTDVGSIHIVFDGIFFDYARNPGMEVRHKLDVVTNVFFDIRFADTLTNEYGRALSALTAAAVPTFAANGQTDYVGVVMDTGQTLTTMALVTVGTTDAATGAALGTQAPTAATYQIVRLQTKANGSYAIIDDLPAVSAGLIKGGDTGVAVRPGISCGRVSTAAKQHDIDYVRIWAERA